MNKIALCIPVSVDDWTTERAIIAGNGNSSNILCYFLSEDRK